MKEFWVRIDAPKVSEVGAVYPKWEKIPTSYTHQGGVEKCVKSTILPRHTGSTVTLFEAKVEFKPATHVAIPLPVDNDC